MPAQSRWLLPARISCAHSIIDRRAPTASTRYLAASVAQIGWNCRSGLCGPRDHAGRLPPSSGTGRGDLAPDRHPHRVGRPPIRGVPLPRPVPVRRPVGRSRHHPQRELPRADPRRRRGGEGRVGLRIDDARQRVGISRRIPRRRSRRDEGARRRAPAADGVVRRTRASDRPLPGARARVSARRGRRVRRTRAPVAHPEALHARRRQRVRRRDPRCLRQGVRRELLRDLRPVVHAARPVRRSRRRVQGGVPRSLRTVDAACDDTGLSFDRRERSAGGRRRPDAHQRWVARDASKSGSRETG